MTALAAVRSLANAPIDFARALFGRHVEVKPSGYMCLDGGTVHERDDECPTPLEGDCAECVGVVPITCAGHCMTSKYHSVANRRPWHP